MDKVKANANNFFSAGLGKVRHRIVGNEKLNEFQFNKLYNCFSGRKGSSMGCGNWSCGKFLFDFQMQVKTSVANHNEWHLPTT